MATIDASKCLKINASMNTNLRKSLSDISFSQNDLVWNTLLSLLPKKIVVHCYDNSNDEFVNTLKMIFEKRIEFCYDCNICNIFSFESVKCVKRDGAF